MSPADPRVPHPALLLAGVLCAEAVALALVLPFGVDDAYIVARYAENWVDGSGPVFNPGERINAVTSPLHLGLLALLYGLTGATLLVNKILAIGVVHLALGAALLRRRERGERWLLAALLLPSPFLWLWTAGGLETPYLLALVTGLALVAEAADDRVPEPLHDLSLSLLAGLAFLARFDAIVFVAPVLLHAVWRRPRRAARLLLPAGALAGAWLGFAQQTYGDVLPTSFYTKTPRFTVERALVNGVYLVQFAVLSGAGWVALAAGVRAGRRGLGRALRRRAGLFAGLAGVGVYALAAATVHMMFSYRLLVPYLPALALAVLELRRGRAASRRASAAGAGAHTGWAALALVGLHGVVMAVIAFRSLNPGLLALEFGREPLRNLNRNVPRVMEEAADAIARDWARRPLHGQRAPRLLTSTAGILPYRYRELYVYEQLVSWRERCRYDVRLSADYHHVLVPHNGPLRRQLGAPPGAFELVSQHELVFDGVPARSLVFYRPGARPNRLPPRVGDPCLPEPDVGGPP